MRLYFHGPEGADLRQLGFGWAEGRWHYPVEQMMLTLFPGQKPEYPAAPPDLTGEGPAADLTLERAGDRVVFTARILWEGRRAEGRTDLPAAGLEAPPDRAYRPLSRGLKLSFYQAGTALLGREPAWGALTGVRPVKLPTRVLTAGGTLEAARAELEEEYRVSPARAGLALDCARATLAVRERLGPEEVSLYVGVPFCPTRCAYCSFVSADVGRTLGLLEPYTQALCREVAAAGAGLRRAGRKVRSVYFGGGTPTTLSADQLHRVMSALEDHVDLSGCTEYTVEAGRPDTITAEKLSVLRAHGCDRVSVNPQSMSPDVLRAIGRAHTPEDILRAWDLVAQAGFPVRNMDLIAGLPADSEAGFRDSLDRVLALGAENVTVHTLALKKGSRLMLEGSGLPDGEAVAAMLDYAWQTLRTAGYVPYYLYRQKYMSGGFENVGWCRPGTESIYNICMMEELHSILSLGSGGVTKLISPGGGITRLSNPKYPKEYIEHIDGIAAQKESLDWPAGQPGPFPSFILPHRGTPYEKEGKHTMSECSHDCSSCGESCGERTAPMDLRAPLNELSSVGKVIAVVSGKGGVGKSTVTCSLAAAMAQLGKKVAVLDADITGPSVPTAFGIHEHAVGSELGIYPAVSQGGVELMSLNLLTEHETDPVIWRGPVIAGTVKQFWTDVIWGDVDYMFVDMPPGTGDVPLTVFQSLPVDGVIVVTSPQDLVSMIVTKAVKMAEMMNIPILGIVENYSYFQCPDCGKHHAIFGESRVQEVADGLGLKVLAQLPIDPALAAACDNGGVDAFQPNPLEPLARELAAGKV